MVVVLYRSGWGQTPWTRVEEAAIKDRFLEEGWEWLLFVLLDDVSKPPLWLPKSEIRLSYSQYGFDQLIGAIKLRAEKLGSRIRLETALDRAKRLEKDSLARAERDRLLTVDGWSATQKEYMSLRADLDRKSEEVNRELTTLKVERGFDGRAYTIRTQHMSVNLYLYQSQPATESRIVVQEWNGRLILPQDGLCMYSPGYEPQNLGKKEFYFDYQAAYGWCWRKHPSTTEFQTSAQLAEHITKQLLILHDRYGKGEIRRRGNC